MTSAEPHKPDTNNSFALNVALAAEHAAIYAYGIVAAFSNPNRANFIAATIASHRARRDSLSALLEQREAHSVSAEAGYTVALTVNDPVTAAQLGLQIEMQTAQAWRSAIERSSVKSDIQLCIDALAQCAIQAASWRQILNIKPTTIAFPGSNAS
ncbi:MAG: ferritin-like domain-containing protein [Mycobacteriaceae bacterium]